MSQLYTDCTFEARHVVLTAFVLFINYWLINGLDINLGLARRLPRKREGVPGRESLVPDFHDIPGNPVL